MIKKKLSEFLKENGAYESFIENCLNDENTLQDIVDYNLLYIGIFSGFTWVETSEGKDYWEKLYDKLPNDITNDMDEILYKEYAERKKKEKRKVKERFEDTKQESEPFTLKIEINTLDEAKSLGNKFNLNFISLYEAIQGK